MRHRQLGERNRSYPTHSERWSQILRWTWDYTSRILDLESIWDRISVSSRSKRPKMETNNFVESKSAEFMPGIPKHGADSKLSTSVEKSDIHLLDKPIEIASVFFPKVSFGILGLWGQGMANWCSETTLSNLNLKEKLGLSLGGDNSSGYWDFEG